MTIIINILIAIVIIRPSDDSNGDQNSRSFIQVVFDHYAQSLMKLIKLINFSPFILKGLRAHSLNIASNWSPLSWYRVHGIDDDNIVDDGNASQLDGVHGKYVGCDDVDHDDDE